MARWRAASPVVVSCYAAAGAPNATPRAHFGNPWVHVNMPCPHAPFRRQHSTHSMRARRAIIADCTREPPTLTCRACDERPSCVRGAGLLGSLDPCRAVACAACRYGHAFALRPLCSAPAFPACSPIAQAHQPHRWGGTGAYFGCVGRVCARARCCYVNSGKRGAHLRLDPTANSAEDVATPW